MNNAAADQVKSLNIAMAVEVMTAAPDFPVMLTQMGFRYVKLAVAPKDGF